MSRLEFFQELWLLMRERKRYWVVPLIVILTLFGLLLVFTETSALAPFVYTLF